MTSLLKAKSTSLYFLPLALFVLCLSFSQAWAAGYELPLSGRAGVTFVEGLVNVCIEDQALALQTGDQIKAPAQVKLGQDARLEILMPEGSVLRFSAGTEFTLVKAIADVKNRYVEVDVTMGDAWAKVSDFFGEDGDNEFSLNSPTAVAGVAGTTYRLHVDQKSSTYRVYQGRINVANRWTPEGTDQDSGAPHRVEGPERVEGPKRVDVKQWEIIVSSGYMFTVGPRGQYAPPVKFDLERDKKDPWTRWNMERDELLKQ
ncbi:MAG: FecR family protein [Thermodesulfobacteriota bacterium]|nr:FecR family protein [Thermodesulfobacteriota bacterium]